MALQTHGITIFSFRQPGIVISSDEIDQAGNFLWELVLTVTLLALNASSRMDRIEVRTMQVAIHMGLHDVAQPTEIWIRIAFVKGNTCCCSKHNDHTQYDQTDWVNFLPITFWFWRYLCVRCVWFFILNFFQSQSL